MSELIPDSLYRKCSDAVDAGIGANHRLTRRLPTICTTRNYMFALSRIEDLRHHVQQHARKLNMRKYLWFLITAIVVISFFSDWKIILAVAPCLLAVGVLTRAIRDNWLFYCKLLLCLEIFEHDFVGWGSKHPD